MRPVRRFDRGGKSHRLLLVSRAARWGLSPAGEQVASASCACGGGLASLHGESTFESSFRPSGL